MRDTFRNCLDLEDGAQQVGGMEQIEQEFRRLPDDAGF